MGSDRRNFLKKSGLALAGAGAMGSLLATEAATAAQAKKVGANDKIRYGVIGCKGMGWSNMRAHLGRLPEVECVAMCDVDESVLAERISNVEQMRGNKPKGYSDYRKMLDDKDIDAIVIGTPDHWHCLQMVDACMAGKDVFVEKPLANSIAECQVMVAAANRYNRIVQVGQWQRSGYHYSKAIEYLKSGKLGQIRLVKCWAYQGWMKSIPVKPDGNAPKGVDYDMWLGPAPKRPFNENRFHFTFRWFWDYAGGLMTDWGVHEIDIALFAMGATAPKSVMASGGKFAYPDDAAETPDTLQAIYEYDNFTMLWEHAVGIDGGNYGLSEGIAFIGNNGTLVLNRGGWRIIPETDNVGRRDYSYRMEMIPNQPSAGEALPEHCANFVEAMKARDPKILRCGIESGSVAAINAQMGNIALKVGRKVHWDAAKNLFVNDAEANKLITPVYNNGWKLPKV